jgi:hypothetical protein
MTYSAAALSSAETTGFNADKPLLVVQQAGNPGEAHWTTTGNLTGTDVTLPAEPAARAYDDIGNLVTSTTGVASTSPKYYGFTFSTAISFDTLLILGHNFNSISITSVALEIADAADFGTNKIEIAKYTISGAVDNRILITNLNSEGGSSTYSSGGTAQRYSSVLYARLVVTHSGSKDPELGEIILGYRYQLQRNPDLPWNNKAQASAVTDFVSNTGMLKRYVLNRGKAARSFRSSMGAAAEIAVIDAWFAATEEGTRNFVYIETPSSSPKAYLMAMVDSALNFPLVGPFERVLEFAMTEQPPFLARE